MTIEDLTGVDLTSLDAAVDLADDMLETYRARPSLDASALFVVITDEHGNPLTTVGEAVRSSRPRMTA
jgi:hypothetical protein